jgi:lysophospholipase L1-like esterase
MAAVLPQDFPHRVSMKILTLARVLGLLFPLVSPALAAAPGVPADAQTHWVAGWATALQPIPQRADLPPLYRAPEVAGRTVRQIVYPTLSGHAVRIRVSNQYGRTALVIRGVHIARSLGGAGIESNRDVPVTFGGKPGVSVPAGADVESDPVSIEIAAGTPYAISSYMGQEQAMVAWHRVASQINYVSPPGDHIADASGAGWRERFTQYAWVSGLSVEAPGAATIAAIGDSITDGMRSTLNRNQRWPDELARRLAKERERSVGVVNLGISGNRLLSDSPCYGEALEKRFGRDALAQPGVRAVVLLIGINDINFAAMPPRAGLDCDFPHTQVTAQALIDGYKRVIAEAHRRGVRIYGATLTPASLPSQREMIRLTVNNWIRTGAAFDGVVDFDGALRDPVQPDRLRAVYDSGDHVHPSDRGYAEMARAVPHAVVAAAAEK